MNAWTCALDRKALKMGILKLSDMHFTCPRCYRKVPREEGLYIRETSFCTLCAEKEKGSNSSGPRWFPNRFRTVPAWLIPGLR
jgi:hypothetical protein